MNQPTEQPCAVCEVPVDPETAHPVHEKTCPNSGTDQLSEVCACDRWAHPACCPVPQCRRQSLDDLRLQLARATWLLGYIAKRLVVQPDGTARVHLSAGTVDSLKEYSAKEDES